MTQKKVYSKRWVIILAFLHSVWLVTLSYWLLNWYFVHWDEGEIIQFGPILKKLVLGWEEKPDRNEYMFINVSNDFQLVDRLDEFGFPVGNEPITDRDKLADLFTLIQQTNNHKAILCDIRFDIPSENDSALQASVGTLKRAIFSSHLINGKLDSSVIRVNGAVSDYPVVGGGFFKFNYFFQDTVKTTPVRLLEMTDGRTFEKKGEFITDGNYRYLNTFLPELTLRPFDLFKSEEPYFYSNLGELLFLDSAAMSEITKDRIIVIGDFERADIHETLLGDMPGPLILINAYITLKDGINRLNPWYVLFLLLGYFLLSLIILVPGDPVERFLSKISGSNQFAQFFANFFSYFLLLLLIVFLSYMIFDVLLNVLWLTFYLYILDKIATIIYKRRNKKAQD